MDNLNPRQRSLCMSRVRQKDTDLERLIGAALKRRGLRFRKHVATLPGRPDVVFTDAKVAVFVDGDFWHGYRYPYWSDSLSRFWRIKISANRARDRRNFARLRRGGWAVVRIWQHEINGALNSCIARIEKVVRARATGRPSE